MQKLCLLTIIFIVFLILQSSVKAETSLPGQKILDADTLFPDGVHRGDITLSGEESLVLEKKEFKQFGKIYLKDYSRLIIRNASLQITRQRADWHAGIYPEGHSSLEIDNSILYPGNDTGFVIEAWGASHVSMNNSPTNVHLFFMMEDASAEVENSEILFDIGGAIGALDRGFVKVKNSKIGGVVINVPPEATLFAEGLDTGFYKKWSLQENLLVSNIKSNIILENTELVPDDLEPGGFERSWTFFLHSNDYNSANVSIKNSNVRRIVFTLHDETAEFSNLPLRVPTNYKYKGIGLENVNVSSQWGIFINGLSDVVVRDSEGLFTIIYDNSRLTLINTSINEFNTNNFRGEIIFENSTCVNPLIIIGNNDFVIKGNCKIDPGLIPWTRWEDSSVTKFYAVLGEKQTKLTLEKDRELVWSGETNENGEAEFSIKVDDATFMDTWILKDGFGNSAEVGFFSETPIKLENVNLRNLQLLIGIAVILFVIALFLFWKKHSKKEN